MEKKVLSEIAVYGGEVEMPKGFEIDRKKIISSILDAGAEGTNPPKKSTIYYITAAPTAALPATPACRPAAG